MNRVLSHNLWHEIEKLAQTGESKRAAIAYVSTDDILQFAEGDLLIVDASDAAIQAGQTSAQVLSRAFDRGADLYSCPGLHAKVIVLGHTAIVGSSNLSASSVNTLIEAALVSDRPEIIAMVHGFVSQLEHKSQRMNPNFIEHILSLKVNRKFLRGGLPPKRTKKVTISESILWMISTSPLDDDEFPDEIETAEQGQQIAEKRKTHSSRNVSWIRYTGSSRFRREAKEGDRVIQIWKERGAKIPSRVYQQATILYRQDELTCTRFYIEESRSAEKISLAWPKFKNLLKTVGFSAKVRYGSIRAVHARYVEDLTNLWGKI